MKPAATRLSALAATVLVILAPAFCPSARAQAAGTFKVLHAFSALNPTTFANSDGADPVAALAFGQDGNLYGTAEIGGAGTDSVGNPQPAGTIFRVTPAGAFDLLYTFGTVHDSHGNVPDGAEPATPLLLTSNGNFYGSSTGDGGRGDGTLFRITPNGAITTLASPYGADTKSQDGPISALALGSNGILYGTTGFNATIVQLTPAGVLSTLYSFITKGEGSFPTVIVASDGNLYGTINSLFVNGGANDGDGAIFKLTPAGVLTILHAFTGSDGANPYANLVEGSDGDLYGVTDNGGADSTINGGTFFKITKAGKFTLLHSFGSGDEGFGCVAPLIQEKDGNFYGTANSGGTGGTGTIFKVTPTGTVTTLYNFTAVDSNNKNSDGANPYAALVEGSDGTLYGTTEFGGPAGVGTVFSFKPAVSATAHPAFFTGETALSNGVYYLAFPAGNYFGYYSFLSDPHYIYHFDLGYEYVFDANDGKDGVYLYDFESKDFFYTSPSFPFPYLYDFNLKSVVYYYPDPHNVGHYNTNGVRYFYVFSTGKIISQ